MCPMGHHFLALCITACNPPDLDSYCFVQIIQKNPCALHFNEFILYLTHFLLCYLKNYIFRL